MATTGTNLLRAGTLSRMYCRAFSSGSFSLKQPSATSIFMRSCSTCDWTKRSSRDANVCWSPVNAAICRTLFMISGCTALPFIQPPNCWAANSNAPSDPLSAACQSSCSLKIELVCFSSEAGSNPISLSTFSNQGRTSDAIFCCSSAPSTRLACCRWFEILISGKNVRSSR